MPKVDWSPRRIIEHEYKRALRKLFGCLVNLVEGLEITTPDEVMEAFRKYVTLDFFTGLAESAARRMVTHLRVDQQKTWREAAQKGGRGREIYLALKNEMKGPVGQRVNQIVAENARLISTFPESVSDQVANWVRDQQQKGLRASEMAEELAKKFPDITESRINLIARTETSKASVALTQTRSEGMGFEWYVWKTSKDARVRPSHHHMDGVLCAWVDPPNPEMLNGEKSKTAGYAAGGIYNCRCYPAPLLRLDQVEWPHKVHSNGQISSMTRSRFERLSGMGDKKQAA